MNIKIIDCFDSSWLSILQKIPHDFYHLPEYVSIEASRTKTFAEAILITEGECIFFLPYLLRKIDYSFAKNLGHKELYDVVSPYGYPGLLLNEAANKWPEFINVAIDRLLSTWRDRQICSAFIRLHPILNRNLNEKISANICQTDGMTISIDLQLSDTEIWQQTRPSNRNVINKCKRNGLVANILPFKNNIEQFLEIYRETMDRLSASNSYYFSYDYLNSLAKLEDKIYLCTVKLEKQVICAGLFTECCGIVQYYLSGTKTEFRKLSASTLMLDYVRFWAKRRDNKIFHLGGGVGGSQDSLFQFKASFSKQFDRFTTLRAIVDREVYGKLVELQAKSLNFETEKLLETGFFPAYRASSIA
ncbi:MAG: FemAB family protein [Xenococcaceae cyanobacterium]